MNLLYEFYIESLTVPIPEKMAEKLCFVIQDYFKKNKFGYSKFFCHLCDGKGYNDGKNNRGCSLINHIFDKINSDGHQAENIIQ
jgi:hypothetical protein